MPAPRLDSACPSGEGLAWHWAGAPTFLSVRDAAAAARNWLARTGVPEEELTAWELILTEAGNNVVEHGVEGDTTETMEFDLAVLPGRIVARITDHSSGFDWPDSIALPDDDSESGRGLFLMEALTTSRDYLRGSHGNILTLERNCGHSPATGPSADVEEMEDTLNAMTEELSACYESLSAIFRFTAESRQSLSLTEFAGRLLTHLITVTGADSGMLRVAAGKELMTLAAHGCEPPLGKPTSHELAAMSSRQDQWIEAEDAGGGAGNAAEPRLLAGLVHPFYYDDELMGILTLERQRTPQSLNAGEVNIVHTFAEFFTQHVLSRRHEEAAIQTSIARREIELAAEIQRSLLPRHLPEWPGISIAAHCESALTVGGDFYDIVPWVRHGFLFVVADVMGKGMGASMMAAATRLAFRSLSQYHQSPSQVMKLAARLLFDDLDRLEMFVTVAVGIVDLHRREVRIANAGHCPVLVSLPDGTVVSCEPTMPPLGLEKDPVCAECTVPFAPGSRLLAYSDGLIDPRDERTPFHTPDAVGEWMTGADRQHHTAEALKDALLEKIGYIPSQGPSPCQADDQTILIVSCDHAGGLY